MSSTGNINTLENTASVSSNFQSEGEPMAVSEDEECSPSKFIEYDDATLDGTCVEDPGRGVPIADLREGFDRWGPPPLPSVRPSPSHTVLYKLPWKPGRAPEPYPRTPCDRWDQDHVRMPNSSESLYPVQESEDEKGLRLRWELVQEALLRPICNSQQLESAILSYNSRYNERWNFRALHTLFNEVLDTQEAEYFFRHVLPAMVQLALRLPELITGPIPLLRKHKNHTISLSQMQIGSILANAFFCTFPRRNSTKRGSEYAAYPDINFNRLFQCGDGQSSSSVLEKLKCILNYFRRICLSGDSAHNGVVTFSRRYIPPGSFPNWTKCNKPLPKMHITSSGCIEDEGSGMLQVDFANKFVGGGVLGWGCVQEEIRFVICPELIVSRLFTECLDTTEALIIVGCERFSKYGGYGHTFEWIEDFQDETPLDSCGRRHCALVAMDALCFSKPSSQYFLPNIIREVNKAYVGFCETEEHDSSKLAPVATGNWGCGAFRGDAHLKSLLQLVAAGESGRDVVYFTFGDEDLRNRIYGMYKFLVDNDVNVGKLWNLLCKYSRMLSRSDSSVPELYDYLYSSVLEAPDSTDFSSDFAVSVKPTLSLKRKSLTEKPKSSCGRNVDATSNLAEAGLTSEDLDSLIEDYESDDEEVKEARETKETDSMKKIAPPSTSSSSCLNLIEEGLQKEATGSKLNLLHKGKDEQKPASIPVRNKEVSDSFTGKWLSSSDASGTLLAPVLSSTVAESESISTPDMVINSTIGSTHSNSRSSEASRSSGVKRNIAPKRKISDYFNPV